MIDRVMHLHEIKCAHRMDGHQYQRQHRTFNFSAALATFRATGNWEHLDLAEAGATMSLLEKALQLWRKSANVAEQDLDEHYRAFHSLYDLLKDV
jgi:hypothetical protein